MLLNEENIKNLKSPDKELVQGFMQFEKELAEYRFHRSPESDKWLEQFILYLKYDFLCYLDVGHKFYRARNHIPTIRYTDQYEVHKPQDMGAPPKFVSSEGRANAPGIPLLYGASNKETAAIEIRSNIGESISIATFSVSSRIKCLDFTYDGFLRDPLPLNTGIMRERSCPFEGMLMIVNHIFSTPTLNNPMQYIPSQVISEAIKIKGYEAIAFESRRSKSSKYNFVFLKVDSVKIEQVESFNVDLHLDLKVNPSHDNKSTLEFKFLQGPPLNNGPGGFRGLGTISGVTK